MTASVPDHTVADGGVPGDDANIPALLRGACGSYAHTIAGGAFAGIGGATYTLAITPQWVDGITGGAGWIAIALVIFAFWRPELCLVGAYFFGALLDVAPELQARQISLGPTVLWTSSIPYLATIAVLVLVSASSMKRRLGAPAALGIAYTREER